ncbi:hypothetical protein NLJ89_g5305 [Agrocybe chaxingu]|uniref:NACHT domain-containing protein n=1 Tax=Agrocybe chaxingu TaxID=84603 RepID=A0A9W8JYT4_9AGAR|nr:hypothetical protein NLJ89_g5305 [Agrocybe chaxingu]
MFDNSQNLIFNGGAFWNVNGNVWQHQESSSSKGFELLRQQIAPGALHDSEERYDPPKCHPLTRQAVLDKLIAWIENIDNDKFDSFWLYGSAGVGKSAILQTIAEFFYVKRRLLASFFFSRNSATRNNRYHLIATLAYQIALCSPQLKEHIGNTVHQDPTIFDRSPEAQLRALVVGPLLEARKQEIDVPLLIIVDGLDECHTPDDQVSILRAFTNTLKEEPLGVKLLIASRPERLIRVAFDNGTLRERTRRLSLDDKSLRAFEDIEVFVRHKFLEIKSSHPLNSYIPPEWPPKENVDLILSKASGNFILPSVVMRYIESPRHLPVERLKIICESSKQVGEMPYAELDALYTTILSGTEHIKPISEVLGILTLRSLSKSYNFFLCLTLSFFAEFLGYAIDDLRSYLMDLNSLIDLENGDDSNITIFHASVTDFLTNEQRSKQFYLDARLVHSHLAIRCIFHSTYIFKLDPKSNSEPGIMKHIRAYISDNLTWHLREASPTQALVDAVSSFDAAWVLDFSGWGKADKQWLFFAIVDSIRDSHLPEAERFNEKYAQLDMKTKHVLEMQLKDLATFTVWNRMRGYDGIPDGPRRNACMWRPVLRDIGTDDMDPGTLHHVSLADTPIDGHRYASLALRFSKLLCPSTEAQKDLILRMGYDELMDGVFQFDYFLSRSSFSSQLHRRLATYPLISFAFVDCSIIRRTISAYLELPPDTDLTLISHRNPHTESSPHEFAMEL